MVDLRTCIGGNLLQFIKPVGKQMGYEGVYILNVDVKDIPHLHQMLHPVAKMDASIQLSIESKLYIQERKKVVHKPSRRMFHDVKATDTIILIGELKKPKSDNLFTPQLWVPYYHSISLAFRLCFCTKYNRFPFVLILSSLLAKWHSHL